MTLRSLLDFNGVDTSSYGKLLYKLHNTEFVALIHMDTNRIVDALEFRRVLAYYELTEPVGMLEMMMALARRLEADIMQGTVGGDRTAVWFLEMIESLGLLGMTDSAYDEAAVSKILRRFLRRRYSPDGRGGLFTVSNCARDMRREEIWYQAALYLNNVLRNEGFIE